MPRVIATEPGDPLALADFIDGIELSGFDPDDEDSFAGLAPLLRRLACNRRFLGDLMIEALAGRCREQERTNPYNAQVIMLHQPGGRWFLRANLWPSDRDSISRQSGLAPFFYHVPHDHNFSFLTVGYFGPGYWSDYYEHDFDGVGVPGAPAGLRFTGRSRLEEGKVMLYRAHRDVHDQLPADSLSVSLNIMQATRAQPFLDQYRFDAATGAITANFTRSAIESLLALAVPLGGDEALDLAERFAERHPCDRIRFGAVAALAAAAPDLDERHGVFARWSARGSPFVAAMARRRALAIERDRDWIGRAADP